MFLILNKWSYKHILRGSMVEVNTTLAKTSAPPFLKANFTFFRSFFVHNIQNREHVKG